MVTATIFRTRILRIPLKIRFTYLVFATALVSAFPRQPVLTAGPCGPYKIAGNQILDCMNRPWLARGTRLAAFTLAPTDYRAAGTFGPWSATTLASIRQRLNMNTVRI